MSFIELRPTGPVLNRLHAPPRPMSRGRQAPPQAHGSRPQSRQGSRRPSSRSGSSRPSSRSGSRRRLPRASGPAPPERRPASAAPALAAGNSQLPAEGPAFSFGSAEKPCLQPARGNGTPAAVDVRPDVEKVPCTAFGPAPEGERPHWYRAEHCAPGPGAYEGAPAALAASSAVRRPRTAVMGNAPARLLRIERERKAREVDQLWTAISSFGQQPVAGKATQPGYSFGTARKLPPAKRLYSAGAGAGDVVEGGGLFSSFKGGPGARFGTAPVPNVWGNQAASRQYDVDKALRATSRYNNKNGVAWGPPIPKPRVVKGRVQVEGHFYRF